MAVTLNAALQDRVGAPSPELNPGSAPSCYQLLIRVPADKAAAVIRRFCRELLLRVVLEAAASQKGVKRTRWSRSQTCDQHHHHQRCDNNNMTQVKINVSFLLYSVV